MIYGDDRSSIEEGSTSLDEGSTISSEEEQDILDVSYILSLLFKQSLMFFSDEDRSFIQEENLDELSGEGIITRMYLR